MNHGVFTSLEDTPILAAVKTDSAIPFVVGTAPIHKIAGSSPSVNQLEKISSWQDFVDKFGYIKDFGRYTLCEFAYAWFRVFGQAPLYCVNEFDPSAVTGTETTATKTLANGAITVEVAGILVQSVSQDSEGVTDYVEGTDYTLSYDEDGYATITRIVGGAITSDTATIYVNYLVISATHAGIDSAAIITGLDFIDDVYSTHGDVPSLIACPGYSELSTVMASMVAKAKDCGGGWQPFALTDIDTSVSGADVSSEAALWKSNSGYTSEYQDVNFGMPTLGDLTFHASTYEAGILAQCDADHGGIPYVSGSNRVVPMDGLVNAAGTAIFLTEKVATDDLNAHGINTFIRQGDRGWIFWGNMTGAYPGSTDPALMWRAWRRFFGWLNNTIRLDLAQKVDEPGNYRQIESIINFINIRLNGIAAEGGLVGTPSVQFRREDNPQDALEGGTYKFYLTGCPPVPMQEIIVKMAPDPSQLETLFAAEAS